MKSDTVASTDKASRAITEALVSILTSALRAAVALRAYLPIGLMPMSIAHGASSKDKTAQSAAPRSWASSMNSTGDPAFFTIPDTARATDAAPPCITPAELRRALSRRANASAS